MHNFLNNLSFTLTDAFLLIIIIAILGAVIYFRFIKNDNPCSLCEHKKSCNNNCSSKSNIVERYYKDNPK